MGIYWRRGAYNVEAYDPARRRNVYVGRRKLEREAKALLRERSDSSRAVTVPR
jgi:hypothetical protein